MDADTCLASAVLEKQMRNRVSEVKSFAQDHSCLTKPTFET